MNKIYKLVWSKVRNTWVVASEIAKGHGESSSSEGNGKLLKSLVLMALLGCFVTAGTSPVAAELTPDQQAVYDAVLQKLETEKKTVHYFSVNSGEPANPAGTNWNNDGATGEDAVAIGSGAKAEKNHSTAIGSSAKAGGYQSTAIGSGAVAQGTSSIALGYLSKAQAQSSIALGFDAVAQVQYSTALGGSAKAQGDYSTAVGNSAIAGGYHSTAIGDYANAQGAACIALGYSSKAQGMASTALGGGAVAQTYSTALGDGAKAATANGVAIGTRSEALVTGSIALGEGTVAGREAGTVGYLASAGGTTLDDVLTALDKKTDYDNWTATINASKAEYERLTKAYFDASDSDKPAAKTALDKWKGEHQDFVDALEARARLETIWKANRGAVSVGGESVDPAGNKIITSRQITNVAAGTEDTDAVNVAQLKTVAAMAKSGAVNIEAGDNVTVSKDANTGKYKISAADTTLKPHTNALSISNGKLKLSMEDTKGNKVTGSVDLNSIQGAVGTDTTYTMTGTKNAADNTTTISLKGSDGKEQTVTVATKDTNTYTTGGTYDAANKKLVFTQSDPDKNYEVDVSAMIGDVVDTNTTYTMTGTKNAADNTTTISLKGSDGKEQTVTVATKDTNTYTTGGKYDAATKTIKFTRSDNATYDVDISDAVSNVTDTRNTIVDSDTVTVEAKAQADGSNEYKLNVKTDGKVEKDNKGIVTGGTVYNETRIEKDGKYIKKDNTAGKNLSALDKQVGINTEKIQKLDSNVSEQMTGLDTRIKTNTENLTVLNGRVDRLDTRVNRVGAGAAALAGLHPLDYDPDNKWDFAAGYGNYNGANAVAVGAFYRPDENKIISIGGSFGGGENMVSAGVSVKLGQRTGISTSKVAMANEIKNLKIENERMQAENKEMKQEIEVLKEQMQKLLAGK